MVNVKRESTVLGAKSMKNKAWVPLALLLRKNVIPVTAYVLKKHLMESRGFR